MNTGFKNVLVLTPHTYDVGIGAEEAIAKLVESRTHVAFSAAEESVPAEFPLDILRTEVKVATRKLGIKTNDFTVLDYKVRKLNYARQDILEDLIRIRASKTIDLVLMPTLKDKH